jgi:hypothetical protein
MRLSVVCCCVSTSIIPHCQRRLKTLPLPESADEVETLRVAERPCYDVSYLIPSLVIRCLVNAILPQNQWTWGFRTSLFLNRTVVI